MKRSSFILYTALVTTLAWQAIAQDYPYNTPKAQTVGEAQESNSSRLYFIRGKNLFEVGKASSDPQQRQQAFTTALEILSDYLKQNPQSEDADAACWYIGNCYYFLGGKNEAKQYFEKLINKQEPTIWGSAAAITLANEAYNSKNYKAAAPLFLKYSELSTKPLEITRGYFYAALSHRLDGNDDQAARLFQQVLSLPDNIIFRAQTKLSLAHLTNKAGRFEEALELFKEVAQDNNYGEIKGEALYYGAGVALKLEKIPEAKQLLESILNSSDTAKYHAEAQFILMQQAYNEGDFKAVIDYYLKRSVTIDKEKEASRLTLCARAYFKLQRYEEASVHFRMIEQMLPPENDSAFQAAYYRLLCFFNMKSEGIIEKIDSFLEIYRKDHAQDKRIHVALLVKANKLFNDTRYADASRVYSQIDASLISEKYLSDLWFQRGWCYLEAGDATSAVQSFTTFINKFPKDERVYIAYGKRASAYSQTRELDKALADYDFIIKEQRDAKLISFAWLGSAQAAYTQDNYNEMIRRYQSLLAADPSLTSNITAQANYFIGWGLVKKEQVQEAIPYLEKARTSIPRQYNKRVGILLVLSYFAQQNAPNLAKEIDRAIDGNFIDQISAQAIQWCANQSFNAGAFTESARFFQIISTPSEPKETSKDVWRYLGKSQLEINQPEAALQSIEHVLAVEDDPAWKADAILDQSKAYFILKDYQASRKKVDQALAMNPQGRTNAGLRLLSGKVFLAMNEPGRAAADLLYVVNFHEDQDIKPQAIYYLFTALEKQNQQQEAEKYRTMLKSKFPDWKP